MSSVIAVGEVVPSWNLEMYGGPVSSFCIKV